MLVKTTIFELWDKQYRNLSELARAMGISVSQIYRVKEGKRRINQKFIVGAIKAFPHYTLDDLFYLAPETSVFHDNGYSRRLAGQLAGKSVARGEQLPAGTQPALSEFTSAAKEYGEHLKSHICAVRSLNETSQAMKRGAAVANRILAYRERVCN